ncbi:hypothetical protein HYT53_03585 [Candidatus Woesearchaeota archaeon]|nr:hypothetical protein [Candidatus Woesearchaeota archaeon]
MKINHERDSYAIPFKEVIAAIEAMPYASGVRVMFQMLVLTGCRPCELDNMKVSRLFGDYLYWPLGKNQKGWRKEKLGMKYIKELKLYRERNRVYGDRLFGFSANSFRRYFNKFIRPHLSEEWNEKRLKLSKSSPACEYVLQIKGLRKDFQTLEFAKQYKKWKSPDVAMEFTSKKMKHSSKHITAYHYLENFDTLGIDKFQTLTPQDIIRQAGQSRLFDFI